MWIEALTTLRVVALGDEEPRWLREGDDALEVDGKTGAELVKLEAAVEVAAPPAPPASGAPADTTEAAPAAGKKKASA